MTIYRWTKYICFLFVALIAVSCASVYNPNVERGATYQYQYGHPVVNFNAIGYINNKPTLELTANIAYNSLLYVANANIKKSNIVIYYRVINTTNSDSVADQGYKKIMLKNTTSNGRYYTFQKQLEVKPGDYKVYFTVTNLGTIKSTTRMARASILDPNSHKINLTSIQMLGKKADVKKARWKPITTYSVGAHVDSLLFSFQIANNSAKKPLVIHTKLVRFKADTSYALPFYYHQHRVASSMRIQGIYYTRKTVIQNTTRKVYGNGNIFIQFRFALPERGNYRFAVHADKGDVELYKAREFAIRSPYFPYLKTPREFAKPLAYLMVKKKYKKLLAIRSPDSLREAVKHFWFDHIGDKAKARMVSQLFYNRVVIANKRFSNFEEGWKTDRGYMYILYGPPSSVRRVSDNLVWDQIMMWYYGSHSLIPGIKVLFFRPMAKSKYFPFNHWVLSRNISFLTSIQLRASPLVDPTVQIVANPILMDQSHDYYLNQEQVELWLSGRILQF